MMTSTDPIADMLSRIRNAIAVRKTDVNLPHSKVKEAVARLLQKNGYISEVRVTDASIGKTLSLKLQADGTNTTITEIKRVSKPGRRYYTRKQEIPTVKSGRGIVIVSTSKGMMTGEDARKQGVGGEIICRIY
jgi:small subunit ribosomal protein S8